MKPEELTLENLANLSIVEDDKVQLCLGLTVTLYFENSRSPEIEEALLSCFEEYCSLVGSKLRWIASSNVSKWKTIKDGESLNIRKWVSNVDRNAQWDVVCHGGEKYEDSNQFGISIFSRAAFENEYNSLSYLTASLPMTWFAEHGGRLINLIIGWSERLLPVQGYGGLGILLPLDSPHGSSKADLIAYGIAQRFPGLDIAYPIDFAAPLIEGIRSINWLTVLSNKWIETLGGLEKLMNGVDTRIKFHCIKNGIVIQAGDQPQLGDKNRKYIPEEYRIVSRLLKPIRIEVDDGMQGFPDGEGFDEEQTQKWLARFD